MINGLFLQKETVPHFKRDLIDCIYNNLIWRESKPIICYFKKNRLVSI